MKYISPVSLMSLHPFPVLGTLGTLRGQATRLRKLSIHAGFRGFKGHRDIRESICSLTHYDSVLCPRVPILWLSPT